jgi:hypothetical protein
MKILIHWDRAAVLAMIAIELWKGHKRMGGPEDYLQKAAELIEKAHEILGR